MPRANDFTLSNRYRNSGIALLMLLGSFLNQAVAVDRGVIGLRAEERDPNHWIEKMGTALIEENYRGVFTIARGREFNSIEIDHRYQDGVVTEHLTQQNGPHRRVIRHGQSIECFHEDSASSLDHAVHLGPFSQSFNASLQAQSNHYVSKIIGVDRVAGRQAVVLSVQASAGDRFGFSCGLTGSEDCYFSPIWLIEVGYWKFFNLHQLTLIWRRLLSRKHLNTKGGLPIR